MIDEFIDALYFARMDGNGWTAAVLVALMITLIEVRARTGRFYA